MKIKICGMREDDNIAAISRLNIDYMGFIFFESSPRYAGKLSLQSLAALPESVKKTGVFVNAPYTEIMEKVSRFNLDVVQLHGSETPELCAALRSEGLQVIKAFSIAEKADLEIAKSYNRQADFFLFDTKTPLYGGSGKPFDWEVLKTYSDRVPFFLSGGIGAEDAARIRSFSHPAFHAVDLNSRFEIRPGLKDVSSLRTFINQLK